MKGGSVWRNNDKLEDNIKTDYKESVRKAVHSFNIAQNKNQWFGILKSGIIFEVL
jgi:hypothetical protein